MEKAKLVLAMAALVLAACGGSSGSGSGGSTVLAADAPQVAPPRFAAQVTFGDNLADVGSYAVGAVAFLGGGKFTINGDASAFHPELIGKTWSELIAPAFGLPVPCPAQTGLQGDPARGLSVPILNQPWCYGYAQGGARVSSPIGPGNAATGSPIGQLTVPVATQVANHLAVTGGRFQGNEIVFVMAGESDVQTQWFQLAAGANAAALAAGPDPAAQSQARANYLLMSGSFAIATVAAAANSLATLVREQIVANGANYVVVNNVRDLTVTPLGNAQDPAMRSLLRTMVETFNQALKAGIDGDPRIAHVDLYALSRDEVFNPAFYALSNTTENACGPNALDGYALFCNVYNTWPGVDASHFMYADNLYLTPYAHWLIARQITWGLAWKGWL
jgi:phospholipase/lecithinase/hemolysin